MMLSAVEIGQRVKARRGELGLKQHELAERAGLSPSYVSRLEAGQSGDSVEEYLKIAAALSWTIGRLVGERSEGLTEVRRQLPDGTPVAIIFERPDGSATPDDRLAIQEAVARLDETRVFSPADES